MPDSISVGKSSHSSWSYDPAKVLEEPMPVEPIFIEPLEEVRERVAKRVGKCSVSHDLSPIHPAIQRLLAKDDARRVDYSRWKSDYYAPYLDSPFEQRRLLVLNNVMLALARHGVKFDSGGQKGRDLTAQVGVERVSFVTISDSQEEPAWRMGRALRKDRQPDVDFGRRHHPTGQPRWADLQGAKFSTQLADIVVTIMLRGEEQYRSRAASRYRWELDRRITAKAELTKRREEAVGSSANASSSSNVKREKNF